MCLHKNMLHKVCTSLSWHTYCERPEGGYGCKEWKPRVHGCPKVWLSIQCHMYLERCMLQYKIPELSLEIEAYPAILQNIK